jgi:hypothetical protein
MSLDKKLKLFGAQNKAIDEPSDYVPLSSLVQVSSCVRDKLT